MIRNDDNSWLPCMCLLGIVTLTSPNRQLPLPGKSRNSWCHHFHENGVCQYVLCV